jgi:hypothetical protein
LFRELFDGIHHCRSHSLYWYVLVPWLEAHQQEIDWLRGVARRTESGVLPRGERTLRDLYVYVLSRVDDTLLVRLQTVLPYGTHWEGLKLSLKAYSSFMTGPGFRLVDESEFSPFFMRSRRSSNQAIAVRQSRWAAYSGRPLSGHASGAPVRALAVVLVTAGACSRQTGDLVRARDYAAEQVYPQARSGTHGYTRPIDIRSAGVVVLRVSALQGPMTIVTQQRLSVVLCLVPRVGRAKAPVGSRGCNVRSSANGTSDTGGRVKPTRGWQPSA